MRPLRSLRGRLLLAYAGLLLLGFMGLAWLAGSQLSQAALEDFERRQQAQVALAASSLKEEVEHLGEEGGSLAGLQVQLERLSAEAGGTLRLIGPQGALWLDSRGAEETDNNQHDYPEVAAALEQQSLAEIRPGASGLTLYTAAPVIEDGRVLAVLHLATPLAPLLASIQQRWATLVGGVALLAVVALGISLWLGASLTAPLRALRGSALRLAEGDFTAQLPIERHDEIGELASAFNHMATQVAAMVAAQRAFASNASHELRTPLTTIRLRSEALREGQLDPPTAQRYIVEIDEEAARLGHLVEELLFLSRLEAGRAERGSERVDVARLLRHLIREAEESSEGLSFGLEHASSLPPVEANTDHLRIVLRNLLSNAVKYTPVGGQIHCRLTTDKSALFITIRDSGQGIAPEALPHLFERFYRANTEHSRAIPGSGLGLALVHSLVTLYGGAIEIQSAGAGQGTTARLVWPLPRESPT